MAKNTINVVYIYIYIFLCSVHVYYTVIYYKVVENLILFTFNLIFQSLIVNRNINKKYRKYKIYEMIYHSNFQNSNEK
jgi:hypothetical protein